MTSCRLDDKISSCTYCGSLNIVETSENFSCLDCSRVISDFRYIHSYTVEKPDVITHSSSRAVLAMMYLQQFLAKTHLSETFYSEVERSLSNVQKVHCVE